MFVLLTILLTSFVFWVKLQRYCGGGGGGGSGGCCWVVIVLFVVVVSVVVVLVLVVVEKGGRGLFRCNYDVYKLMTLYSCLLPLSEKII